MSEHFEGGSSTPPRPDSSDSRTATATLPEAAAASSAELRRHAPRLRFVAGGLVRRVELLRLSFGVVWAIDAYLKWKPAFISGYASSVADGAKGQPGWLRPWFRFWRHIVDVDPHLYAYLTAAVETVIAVGLILGLGRRVVYLGGIVWSIAIWTIPEGFGGSFLSGATDIGTAIMYALVFAVLYALEGLPTLTGVWSLDHRIERRLPAWRLLAEPGGRNPSELARVP
jgi:thiosulfate dehydrogenase [quinone] large subunit